MAQRSYSPRNKPNRHRATTEFNARFGLGDDIPVDFTPIFTDPGDAQPMILAFGGDAWAGNPDKLDADWLELLASTKKWREIAHLILETIGEAGGES